MTTKEILARELEVLPENRQESVLAFIRFLKIGLAEARPTAEQFLSAVARARVIGAQRGVTEEDVDREIRDVRAAP
jgi:hypothetical protein